MEQGKIVYQNDMGMGVVAEKDAASDIEWLIDRIDLLSRFISDSDWMYIDENSNEGQY